MEQTSFFDTTRDLILPPVTIMLDREKPMSLNTVYAQRGGWRKRHREAKRVHALVIATMTPEQRSGDLMFKERVHIVLEVGWTGKRRVDPDNFWPKMYIDGLVGRLIEDDSIDHVKSVTVTAERTKKAYVQIIVSPWRV